MTARLMKLAQGLALAAYAAVLVAIAGAVPADAKSRVCRQLEAELSAPSSGKGSSAQVRKYDAAIDRQRDQLGIARKQARDAGCAFSLLSRNRRQCGGLNATIDKMERNLDALQSKREQLGGRKGRSSSKILASLEANGCRDDEQLAMRRPAEDVGKTKRNANLLDQLLRGGIDEGRPEPREERKPRRHVDDEDDLERSVDDDREPLVEAPLETFRTMCVRTCDGYMFPMSQEATVRDFERDQKNCESACPGADIQIFYRPVDSEDTAEMVSSVTGAPYSQMPTANLYKDASAPRDKTCGCNPVRSFEVVAGTPPVGRMSTRAKVLPQEQASVPAEAATTGEAAVMPMPSPRPNPAEALAAAPAEPVAAIATEAPTTEPIQPEEPPSSIQVIPAPEKKAPVVKELGATQSASDTSATAESAVPNKVTTERKVRVVGPTFLPDPETAEVPPVQDQKTAP